MKKVAILGSTGSVGQNALRVIGAHGDKFRVVGLSAGKNAKLLARQAKKFRPRLLALKDISRYGELKRGLGRPGKVLTGTEGISEIASMREADIVVVAMSGTESIMPVISAIRAKKVIALANKESIVSAGRIITDMARTRGARIIPVDSEHSSIFQCIDGKDAGEIHRVFLMGSGGPLKNVRPGMFDRLKPSRILSHPVWKMGKKITVDSATMMNKGLEVIEASFLFALAVSKIEVLLHPEAIIHSMVEFTDGNVMANLYYPDMRFPLFYALSYPKRPRSRLPRIKFSGGKKISFEKPDTKKFPALELCYRAAKKGGTYPACLNAANEEAVRLYLEGKLNFTGITKTVGKMFARHKKVACPSLDEILAVDRGTKEEVRRLCTGY